MARLPPVSLTDALSFQEYKVVSKFYGGERAERSGVEKIKHIRVGLAILRDIDAPEDAFRGFCLHPLFQKDEDFMTSGLEYWNKSISGAISDGHSRKNPIFLAMEYRNQANAWLSDKVNICEDSKIRTNGWPTPGPLKEVRDMLIADKVRNRMDFETYHRGQHVRSKELEYYFKIWLDVLGISEQEYQSFRTRYLFSV